VAIRPIHSFPDAVLKRPAEAVTDIDGAIATLVEDMAETMYAAPGIGLAAPQVGVSRRVLVLDVPEEDEGPGKHLMKLVNPEIVERDGSIVWEEGCLSVPDFTAPVTRAKRILLRAWTPEQNEIEIEAEDLLAVALQHEIDHLDGKLFLDRLSRLKRDLYKARQRKLERQGRSDDRPQDRPQDRPRDRPADRPGARRTAL
jgi:peptide deformylase